MRVAHIITRLVVGGAQENTLATIKRLRSKPDLELSLISGPTIGREGSLEPSARDIPGLLSIIPELVRPVHPWKDLIAYRKLVGLLTKLKPDLVHTHSGKAGILGRLAARKSGVPIILHHIHGPSFGPWQGTIPNFVFKSAERLAGKITDHFLCSAGAMSRLYLAAGIGRPEMYTRVFSGFDVRPFASATASPELRKQLGLSGEDLVIGKVARLAPLKGHSDLIAAAPQILTTCPRARFLIVGDGQLRAQLERSVEAKGLAERFIFTGLVPPEDVSKYIGLMDCLVHLSYREALSRALPQALAAGKPVVAYDFDGADEVCIEGKSGFIVRTSDVNAVADRVTRLGVDAELRKSMGAFGQELVLSQFTIETMVQTQYEVYQRLARAKGIQ